MKKRTVRPLIYNLQPLEDTLTKHFVKIYLSIIFYLRYWLFSQITLVERMINDEKGINLVSMTTDDPAKGDGMYKLTYWAGPQALSNNHY